jgi:hypothetical protein
MKKTLIFIMMMFTCMSCSTALFAPGGNNPRATKRNIRAHGSGVPVKYYPPKR